MSRSSRGGGKGGGAVRLGPKRRQSNTATPAQSGAAPVGSAIMRGGGGYVGVITSSGTMHFNATKSSAAMSNAASYRRHRRRSRRPPGSPRALITMSRAATSRHLWDALIIRFGCWTSGNNDPIEPRPTITAQFNDSPSTAAKLKRLRTTSRVERIQSLRATTGDESFHVGISHPPTKLASSTYWAEEATCATFVGAYRSDTPHMVKAIIRDM